MLAGAALALIGAGAFSTLSGLLVDPLNREFGWPRGTIGLAVSVNMVLYGLIAPFAVAWMDRFGLRRVVAVVLASLALGAVLTTTMTQVWQFTLYWGVLVGLGAGAVSLTFAAGVTNRWFVRRRGLAGGLLAAASVFGQFGFLPALGWIVQRYQWRPALVALALGAAVIAALAYLLIVDHPQDVGGEPLGADRPMPRPEPVPRPARRTLSVLRDAVKTWPFWLLAATFAVCGASTNGVMWTHFVPAATGDGMAVPAAASLLTVIGLANVGGSIGSGWLTDRFDPRLLLTIYYGLRGISLVLLPNLLGPSVGPALIGFAVAFGVLDLATVPPTIALCREIYGSAGAIVFGWMNTAHQVGAAALAFLGGVIRDRLGSYTPMWMVVGALCFGAAALAPLIRLRPRGLDRS